MSVVGEMDDVDETLEDLPPFAPPYVLGGSCLVAVGLWSGEAAVPAGFRPVRLFGRPIAVVIANHYTEPPSELPIRYHEVISASLARRGTTVVAAPFDMVLDERVPVALGRLHYGMPKRFDATLLVENAVENAGAQSATSFSATARDLEIHGRFLGPLASALALPIRLAFALAVRAITATIDVTGAAYPPARRARIALAPRGVGTGARIETCIAKGQTLHPLWCQSWDFTSTNLGAPHPIDPERTP